MSYYLKRGSNFIPTDGAAFDIRPSLPVGTYVIGQNLEGFYLAPVASFAIEGKVYGNSGKLADKMLNTFNHRATTTGILLSGEKGSGKTLLAKLISMKGLEQGISTIIINSSFCGDDFNDFMVAIDEPVIIILDEFEKVYSDTEQERLLTLLEGVFSSKKMFIFTCNNKFKINSHMTNRPGRIFYSKDYGGLEIEFIREYCEEKLNDKQYITQICQLTHSYDAFNFDMLKALVEEMNRYDESPAEALVLLNAKPYASRTMYNVEVIKNGEVVPNYWPHQYQGCPGHQAMIGVNIEGIEAEGDEEDTDDQLLELKPKHLKAIDVEKGSFIYELVDKENVFKVTFQKPPVETIDPFFGALSQQPRD